jgi:predicted RNA-binding protein with TRAM domain
MNECLRGLESQPSLPFWASQVRRVGSFIGDICWVAQCSDALGDEKTSFGRGRGGGYGSSGFGGGFRQDGPKPVEVGKEYDVTISETSRRGDGVAKIDGFVIFVTGGKQGEKTRIKVTQVGPRFASAVIVGAGTQEST